MLIRKKNLLLLTVALFVIATVPSCSLYPDDDTRVEDLDIVLTRFDTANDFTINRTYSLVDHIIQVDDDTSNAPNPITNSSFIIEQIRENMNLLGYTEVNDNQNPDLRILGSATDQTHYFYYYYYDYWYYYGGGWGGYGGWWGYPCCYYYPPTYPVVESYTTGTLLIQMVQMKGAAPGDTLDIAWTAAVNGLLEEDTQANLKVRIQKSIGEAFKQSPYLDVNAY